MRAHRDARAIVSVRGRRVISIRPAFRLKARCSHEVALASAVLWGLLACLSCGDSGDGGRGGAGGATGPLMQLSTTSAVRSASSTDVVAGSQVVITVSAGGIQCVDDGDCRIEAQEACGTCPDCVLGTPDCGACNPDGACASDDACTCPDCRQDAFCGDPTFCSPDGSCDFFSEGCQCDDCAKTSNCAG